VTGVRIFVAVCKLGVVTVVALIAVMLVRGTSPWASLHEKWSMHQCESLVQADLNQVIPFWLPKVESCRGLPENAECIVQTIESGVTKTGPVEGWDCTRRHVPDGIPDGLLSFFSEPKAVDVAAKSADITQNYLEAIRYVGSRLMQRQGQLRR
jgi:hypothetical protein